MKAETIDWAAVLKDMDRGYALLSQRVWSHEAQKWVLREQS
jgi:hypothetical protein